MVDSTSSPEAATSALLGIYDDKPASYFANVRNDIVALLDTNARSSVLELGCGSGGTGQATLAEGKAGRYVGIELSASAASVAREHLAEVLVGDVATVDLSGLRGAFDALIISEVLEHLTDPWTVLRRLRECLKPGGRVYASSPNVAHWKVIRELLAGRFNYEERGVMDRTHLRWFTPKTYRKLFEDTGFQVLEVRPVTPMKSRTWLLDQLTGGRLRHLLYSQTMVVARAAEAKCNT